MNTNTLDPRRKPERGTFEIDWGHPLAQGLAALYLFNEGGGTRVFNEVTQRLVGYQGVYRPRTWGIDSVGSFVQGDIDQQDTTIEPEALQGSGRTFLCSYMPVALGGGGPSGAMIMYLGNSFSAGKVEGLNYRSSTLIEYTINGSDLQFNLGTSTTGKVLDVIGSRSESSGRKLFLAGQQVASDTATLTFTGENELRLGVLTARYYRAMLWNRGILRDEAAWLQAEPFAMLKSKRPVIYSFTERLLRESGDLLIPTTGRTL